MLAMQEIDFYGQPLGLEGCDKVITAFQEKISSESNVNIILDLSSTQLTDECIAKLAPIFLASQLFEVRLDNNQLTANGISALFTLFTQRDKPLAVLSLNDSDLKDNGIVIIANAMAQLRLEALSLKRCGITAVGNRHLAENLIHNQSLETLIIDDNPIEEGCLSLAKMLMANKSLSTLSLCQCKLELSNDAGSQLGIALRHNHSLKSLNIDSNLVDPNFLPAFIAEFCYNNTLTEYFGPDDGNQIIKKICQRNRSVPCNAPWSLQYNPSASPLEKSIGVIHDTPPKPGASLLFLAGRSAISQNRLTTQQSQQTLEQDLLEKTYAAAASQPITPRPS